MTLVFDRYPNGGGEMLLALALADHAHDDGAHIYPGVEHLMQKTRQSERSVRYQLREMIACHWLIPTNDAKGGAGNKREYRISSDWIAGVDFADLSKKGAEIAPLGKGANDDRKGAKNDEKGCNPRPPLVNVNKPSVNRRATRLAPDWTLPKKWGDWVLSEHPAWDADHIRKIALMFRNYWVSKSGRDAVKLDWFATWQNWCLKESPVPAGGKQASTDPTGDRWWESNKSIDAKGAELGLVIAEGELWPHWRDRVYVAAGEGPWMSAVYRSSTTQQGLRQAGNLSQFLKNLPSPSH